VGERAGSGSPTGLRRSVDLGAQATGEKLLRIFLSYAGVDRERVRPIVEGLIRSEMTVWWDREIPPGKTYSAVIAEQLKLANVVVVIWSRASIGSEWVQAEADRGKRRDVLIPVLLDDVADDLPLAFSLRQTIDFRAWNKRSDAREVTQLVAAVKALVLDSEPSAPTPPSPSPLPRRKLPSRLSRRRTLIACGVAVVALLSVAVAIVTLADGSSSPSEDVPTTITLPFEDNFSSPEYGWPNVGDAQFGGRYANGAYRILAERSPDPLGVNVSPANAPTAEDVRIDVEADRIAGSATIGYGYGIFCRASDDLDDLYRFTVWANHAVIQKRVGGEFQPGLDVFELPAGEEWGNELQARCVTEQGGGAVELDFVVGGAALHASDPAPLETGAYGLNAVFGHKGELGETLEVQFDNFAVSRD
jgi:hypothetical protein